MPAALAVTRPLASTSAISLFPLVQRIAFVVAFSGRTVASRQALSPILSDKLSGETVTLVTGIVRTVTKQQSHKPLPSCAVAQIWVVPGALAITHPFSSTSAILQFSLVQHTFFTVASAGSTVASRQTLSPMMSDRLSWEMVTLVTGIV